MAKQRPTRRQLEVLRAYIAGGSVAAAAFELGISETTARQHLSGLYRRTGCLNAAQAAYWLGIAEADASGGPANITERGGHRPHRTLTPSCESPSDADVLVTR